MPFGNGVVVDRTKFADLLHQLRLEIPASVRQARGVIDRTDQITKEAREEAARIIAGAEREAANRASQSEVVRRSTEEAQRLEQNANDYAERTVRNAEQRAAQIVAEAEQIAQQQRDDADAYAVALLIQLQRLLGSFLGNVRESLKAFPDHQQQP